MRLTAVAVTASLLAIAVPGTAAVAQVAKGDIGKGRELYIKTGCWTCHGYNGQGGVTGPKIAPDPMPLEALITFLRKADSTRMPPYDAKGLPDADIGHIHAYLVSLPKPVDWKTIPLLKQ